MNPEIYKREDIFFQAQQRAQATMFGIISGGVLGALFDGPRGALIGSMLGGSIGYAIDSKQRTAHITQQPNSTGPAVTSGP